LRATVEETRGQARGALLQAECSRRLAEGRDALARRTSQDVQAACVLFATVIEDISDEDALAHPALAELRAEARDLECRARELTTQQANQIRDRARAGQFLKLRDEAFFELYRDVMTGPVASRAARSRALARRALDVFPDTASLMLDEARRLQQARQEVLFLLAEGTARLGRPDDWREALALLDQAAAGTSAPHSVLARRSRYLALLGRHAEAARERERASRTRPAGALDWFLTGLDHWQAGDARAALGDFERALEAERDLFWPLFFRGLALRRLDEPAEARAAWSLCARARPEFPWPYILTGYLQVEANNLSAAEVALDRAEQRCELDTAARYALLTNRGVLALKRKQLASSVAYFQRAVLLLPDCYLAHAHLSQAYRKRGQRDRALAAIDHAVRLAPALAELYRIRAELHHAGGAATLALRDLDSAIRLTLAGRSGDTLALDHRERARIFYEGRRFGEALAACRETLKRCPDDPVATRLEAESLLELGSPREALAAYDRYLKKSKPDVELYRRRARARASLGDLAGVVDEYSAALAIRRNAPLLAARGWAHFLGAAHRSALRDFQLALTLDPECGDALAGRGAVRVEMGDWRSGIADAEAALRLGPRSSRHLYNVARDLARAAAIAPADRHAVTRSARAAAVLRDAVRTLPEADQKRFWSEQVRRDSAFSALARTAGFRELDRQFDGPARPASAAR
jgi:tetratricopeptide (TPR) repeat protein